MASNTVYKSEEKEHETHEISFADLSNYGTKVLGDNNFFSWLLAHNSNLQSRPVELMMSKAGIKKVWDELRESEKLKIKVTNS